MVSTRAQMRHGEAADGEQNVVPAATTISSIGPRSSRGRPRKNPTAAPAHAPARDRTSSPQPDESEYDRSNLKGKQAQSSRRSRRLQKVEVMEEGNGYISKAKTSKGNGALRTTESPSKDLLRRTASPTIKKKATTTRGRKATRQVRFSDGITSQLTDQTAIPAADGEKENGNPDVEMSGSSSVPSSYLGYGFHHQNGNHPQTNVADLNMPSRAYTAAESVDIAAHQWNVEQYNREHARDDEPILMDLRHFLMDSTPETTRKRSTLGVDNSLGNSSKSPKSPKSPNSTSAAAESSSSHNFLKSPKLKSPKAASPSTPTRAYNPPNIHFGFAEQNHRSQGIEYPPQFFYSETTGAVNYSPPVGPETSGAVAYSPPPDSPPISLSSASPVGSDFEISDKTWDQTLTEHEAFNRSTLDSLDGTVRTTVAVNHAMQSQGQRLARLFDTVKRVSDVSARVENQPRGSTTRGGNTQLPSKRKREESPQMPRTFSYQRESSQFRRD